MDKGANSRNSAQIVKRIQKIEDKYLRGVDKKSTLKNLNKSIDGGGGNTYHKLSDLVETERGTLNIATNSVALTDFLISQEDP